MTARPESVGRYRPGTALVRSFFGTLWEGHIEEDIEPEASLRVFEPLESADRALILKTARAATTLDDKICVGVREVIDGEPLAVVSAPVDGASMRDILRISGIKRRVLTLAEVTRVAHDMLAGVGAVHRHATVLAMAAGEGFGGVSPDSFIVCRDGATRVIEPLLGAALSRTQAWANDHKRAGYDAPEVIDGKPATARSDLFSVGAIVWELLMGRRLFPGATLDMVKRRVKGSIPPAAKRPKGEEVPSTLAGVLARALARDPGERFGDAAEMSAALESAVDDMAEPSDIVVLMIDLVPRKTSSGPTSSPAKASAPPRASDRPGPTSQRPAAVIKSLPTPATASGAPLAKRDKPAGLPKPVIEDEISGFGSF